MPESAAERERLTPLLSSLSTSLLRLASSETPSSDLRRECATVIKRLASVLEQCVTGMRREREEDDDEEEYGNRTPLSALLLLLESLRTESMNMKEKFVEDELCKQCFDCSVLYLRLTVNGRKKKRKSIIHREEEKVWSLPSVAHLVSCALHFCRPPHPHPHHRHHPHHSKGLSESALTCVEELVKHLPSAPLWRPLLPGTLSSLFALLKDGKAG